MVELSYVLVIWLAAGQRCTMKDVAVLLIIWLAAKSFFVYVAVRLAKANKGDGK